MDRSSLYSYADGKQFIGKPVAEVFREIAGDNFWIEKESSSGFGSTLEQTKEIVNALPAILKAFKVKKLLDLPCGDFNWMKEIEFSTCEYTGGDIVKNIITLNQKRFATSKISFAHLDLMKDDLGEHDMLFCRDCLVHFSFKDIDKALKNMRSSNIRYLMTTTFPEEKSNKDIITGGWRPLNLKIEPFNFPEPLFLLNERCTEMDGAFNDKSLGIWDLRALT